MKQPILWEPEEQRSLRKEKERFFWLLLTLLILVLLIGIRVATL
jgi:hypothetical protein